MPATQPRRTQQERRATTRTHILDCTVASLLERGYTATTISEVQERAGLARGTVQHYFPSKHELVVEATTFVVEARLAQLEHEAQLLPSGTHPLDAFVELGWRDLSSVEFFVALELWVAARTDAALRERLLPAERKLFAQMREVYAQVLGEPYASSPRAAEIVEFTVDLLTGLSLTTMLSGSLGEREAVLRQWKRAIAVLFDEAVPQHPFIPRRRS